LLQLQKLVLAKHFAHLLAKLLGSVAAVSVLILSLTLLTTPGVYAQTEASETLLLQASNRNKGSLLIERVLYYIYGWVALQL
jgi:hypothetical protein